MLVFVHINKTAGSTLRSILRSSYGSRHCEVEPWEGRWLDTPFDAEDLRRVRKLYPNLASIAGHRVVGHVDLQANDLRYLSMLREPLKLAASRYQYRINHRQKHDLTFEQWIDREWVRNPQCKRMAGSANAADAIATIERTGMFVGLTERFDESVVMLQRLVAHDLDISYESVNVANDNTISKGLLSDARTRRLLESANVEDLELYEYVRDEMYPRLRREVGPSLEPMVQRFVAEQRNAFSRRKLVAFRAKQHLVYRPVLSLSRRTWSRPVMAKLVA